MMKNINNIPTLLILKNILATLKQNSSRFVYIKYAHTFHNIILKEIKNLEFHYKIINFQDITSNKTNTDSTKPRKIPNFIINIFQYLVELHPVIAFVDLLANIALDKCGYYLKKTDYQQLKNVLGIRKKPGKHRKLKTIIVVKELQNLKEEEIHYIEFLGFLTQSGYLTNTALLIFSDKTYDTGLKFVDADNYDLKFTSDDFKEYTGELLKNDYLLEIIESLGIEYIDTLQELFESKTGQQFNLARQIIEQLLRHAGYNSSLKELDRFLIICSYLFDEFTYTDIEQINKKIVTNYQSMLPVSINAKILQNPETIIYTFSERKFKEYYLNIPPINILHQDAIKIIDYLQRQYPDRYVDLALAAKFMPLKESEKLSYFIIAYYHLKSQNLRYSNIVIEFLQEYPIGKIILDLDCYRADIRKYSVDDLSYTVNKGIELLDADAILYPEAKLCMLNYISDVAYEIITEQKRLEDIFEVYMRLFQELGIFSAPNERYVDYVLDAVIFSTSIEKYSIQKRVNKLVDWLEKRRFININNKIKFYRLGNLLYVLNIEKALDFTHIAFDISENNFILHEETRLNYSVSLMGAGKYEEAYDVLVKNKISSSDYQNALQNNTIIAGYLSKKYTSRKVLEKFDDLKKGTKERLTSDCCIILNNYVSALILNMCLNQSKKIEQISDKIINHQDSYHTFYALNNLLILYYLNQDFSKFQKVIEQLQVPYLIRKHNDLFDKKINFLKETFFEYYSYQELCQKFKQFDNSKQYANGLYSQPILWGLMERWFK